MQNVLIVGGGAGGSAILGLLLESEYLHVAGVVDINPQAPAMLTASAHGIPTAEESAVFYGETIDIAFNVTGSQEVQRELQEHLSEHTVVIPGSIANVIVRLLIEKEHYIRRLSEESYKQHLIFNSIEEGMVGIGKDGRISFLNRSGARMTGTTVETAIGRPVYEVIPGSALQRVYETGRVELNQRLQLENGLQIVTSRFPMIDGNGETIGAFAVFQDITELASLAEEITDMKEIQTMLQAIIQSSDDAISVVDEKGNGLLINPAYTRITGLATADVIGKPATTDITEGESIHLKVLQQRKPFRGVSMKVGPSMRDVIVNVAPIIVNNQLKGSVGVIHDMTEIRTLMKELDRARSIIRTLETRYTFDDIIGQSSEMQLSLQQAKLAAETLATVLLRGESGTGKELFAHAIHSASDRKYNKFVRVNCASLSEEMLEIELFGTVEGAFVDAKGARKGLFEEANNGSLFLDEIGDLSPATQSKLLHVLEEHEVYRVGGTEAIPVNVRVIAATNSNMEKALLEGGFREDLYYRLNRMPIHLPPLRKRKMDIPLIAERLLVKLNQEYGRNVQAISDKAMQLLKVYDWPGNVRELENVLSRAMIFMQIHETVLTEGHIPHHLIRGTGEKNEVTLQSSVSLQEQLETVERKIIEHTLAEQGGNKSKTAKELDISLRTLYYKLEKYELL